MAIGTRCQTPGARFHTTINSTGLSVVVAFPEPFDIDEFEAALIEANAHNMIEIMLAPIFAKYATEKDKCPNTQSK